MFSVHNKEINGSFSSKIDDNTQLIASSGQARYHVLIGPVISFIFLPVSFELDEQTVGVDDWDVVRHIVGDDGHDSSGDGEDVILARVDQLGQDGGWEAVQGHGLSIALDGTTQRLLRNIDAAFLIVGFYAE